MFAQQIDLSNLGSTIGSTTASTSNKPQNAQEMQDRFLKLLVAQINNQDPLNPMDNAQMTTQMAQINTVSGIQKLNETLEGMAAQNASMQSLQGASLIGREALVEGSSLAWEDAVGKGAVKIDGDASQVYVDIMGVNGEVIDTIDMGSLSAGTHAFEWDADSVAVEQVKGFAIRATNGDEAVVAQPMARYKVDSVSFSNGAVQLNLQNGRTMTYDQVSAFM